MTEYGNGGFPPYFGGPPTPLPLSPFGPPPPAPPAQKSPQGVEISVKVGERFEVTLGAHAKIRIPLYLGGLPYEVKQLIRHARRIRNRRRNR